MDRQSEAEMRAEAADIRRRFCAAPRGGAGFDPELLKRLRWLELNADYAYLRRHGWSHGAWFPHQRDSRYGNREYLIREWRCGVQTLTERDFGYWQCCESGSGSVAQLLEWNGIAKSQLALDLDA